MGPAVPWRKLAIRYKEAQGSALVRQIEATDFPAEYRLYAGDSVGGDFRSRLS
jgi:hypothetical protein